MSMTQSTYYSFPTPPLSAGSKASIVTRRWDTALETNTMTSYVDTAVLINKQRAPPHHRLGSGSKYAGTLDCHHHRPPRTTRAPLSGLRSVKYPQGHRRGKLAPTTPNNVQQDIPAAPIIILYTEFKERLQKVLASQPLVNWPHFTPLIWTLTPGHFHPGTVTMPKGFRPIILKKPAPLREISTPPPPSKNSSTERGGNHCPITPGSGIESHPSPSPPIWTRLPSPKIHGEIRREHQGSSALDIRRPPVLS